MGAADDTTETPPTAAQSAAWRAALAFYAGARVLTPSANNPNGGGWPDDGWEARRALNVAPDGHPYPPTPTEEEARRRAIDLVSAMLSDHLRLFHSLRGQPQ